VNASPARLRLERPDLLVHPRLRDRRTIRFHRSRRPATAMQYPIDHLPHYWFCISYTTDVMDTKIDDGTAIGPVPADGQQRSSKRIRKRAPVPPREPAVADESHRNPRTAPLTYRLFCISSFRGVRCPFFTACEAAPGRVAEPGLAASSMIIYVLMSKKKPQKYMCE